MNRGRYRSVLILQVRIAGQLTPYWIFTEPFVCAVACPTCGAQAWEPCTGRKDAPKVRPHDGRSDAYTAGLRNGSVMRWQDAFASHRLSR